MRRHSRLTVGCGGNASDEMLAVLDVQVSGRIFCVGGDLPSKKASIKIGSALCVGRAQIGPAERARDLRDSDSGALVCLPGAKYRAGRILDDRHPPGVHYVESWGQHFTAELLRFRGGCVCVFYQDVNQPVGRHTLRTLLGTQRASSSRFAALQLEYGVKIVRPHRHVIGVPAKERYVKLLGSGLVSCVEFNPAEGTGGVLINVCHSRRSLHQLWLAGRQRVMKAIEDETVARVKQAV